MGLFFFLVVVVLLLRVLRSLLMEVIRSGRAAGMIPIILLQLI
jgi:hypothetical protein